MQPRPLIAVLIICIVLLINGSLRHHRPELSETDNKPFPTLSLKNDAGKSMQVDTATFGGKVTVINLFASWCTPCIKEIPELINLKKESGAQFHGIVWNDTPATMRDWLQRYGNPFDTVWYDYTGESARSIGLRGVPETFVLDKKGTVRYHVLGMINPELAHNTLLPLIAKLQNE